MTSKEIVANALKGKEGPVPWLEIHVDDQLIANALDIEKVEWKHKVQFAKLVGLDAIGINRWDRFGRKEVYGEKMFHPEPLIIEREDLDKFMMPETIDEDAIRRQVIEAKDAIGDSGLALYAAFLFCLDPVMIDMGFENFAYKIYDDLDFVKLLLEKYTQYNMKLAQIYSEMPEIDFIWIGEDIAFNSGPFLSPQLFRELVMPYFTKIASNIKKPWIYHSDGDLSPILEDLLGLGMNGLHPIQPDVMNIYELKNTIGQEVTLVGNVDINMLKIATKEEVALETNKLLENISVGGHYILSSSNSLPYYSHMDNITAIGHVKREFNKKKWGLYI